MRGDDGWLNSLVPQQESRTVGGIDCIATCCGYGLSTSMVNIRYRMHHYGMQPAAFTRFQMIGATGLVVALGLFTASAIAADTPSGTDNIGGQWTMYDPDLYLFINDDAILARNDLYRMVHTLRRESVKPVLSPTEEEGRIDWSSTVRDPETGQLKMWYHTLEGLCRLAVSDDGFNWIRCGKALSSEDYVTNDLSVAPVGPDVDPWFRDAKFVGAVNVNEPRPGEPGGIHAVRSMDGEQFEVLFPAILPGKGDRMSIAYDSLRQEYILITRPYYGFAPGFRPIDHVAVARHRMARMWKSRDMVTWQDYGIVLRHDDNDPPDVQIHGMQCFRYGQGFLALIENMFLATSMMDVQLGYSSDGINWERVGNRESVLPLGGQGSWDSHSVVPGTNAPIPDGERILVPYTGRDFKFFVPAQFLKSDIRRQQAKGRQQAIGLATIRKDGWVSLEAGRVEGTVVTQKLPLTKPMKLELNVDCYGGYIAVDVIADAIGKYFEPVPGYEADASRMEHVDSICQPVTWGEREVVEPIAEQSCFLRFTMRQGSLFSYRWTEAD